MVTYVPLNGHNPQVEEKKVSFVDNLFNSVGNGVKKFASLFGKSLQTDSRVLGRNVLITASAVFAIGGASGGKCLLDVDKIANKFALRFVGHNGSHKIFQATATTVELSHGGVRLNQTITLNTKKQSKWTCFEVLYKFGIPKKEYMEYCKLK